MPEMRRRVLLSPDAVRQLRVMRGSDRALLKEAMRIQLQEAGAETQTQHRCRLRRPSEVADFELRVRDWRVFYRVRAKEVEVVLIGRKRGSHLIVDRRRFVL